MAKRKSSGEINHILIVDDQPEVRDYVRNVLEQRGYEVLEAADGEQGLDQYRKSLHTLSLVILDLDFGVGAQTGIELLREMKKISDEIPVMILTGKGSASEGAEAIRLGAADVLEKDVYIEQNLDVSVEKISRLMRVVEENRRLVAENARLRTMTDFYESEFRRKYTMVGESPAFANVVDEARRIANVPRPVLIRGERGTGKELAAALIHYSSDRHDKPFITVNCAAFHGNLLESEIFGHEKGAFTGADKLKIGRFELADGGTIFLDEIGNMALEFQEKILRVIEYQKFERVAGSETIAVDVRVVAATNADLETMMKEGSFRPDLYDRLSFKVLKLPQLKDRREDIPLLVKHFRNELIREVPWVAERSFSDSAIKVLTGYAWPGNIRELKNVVERLLCGKDKPLIDAAEAGLELGAATETAVSSAETFHEKIAEREIQLLLEALRTTGGNQRAAADQLDLTYDQLRHLYKKYSLKDRMAGAE